MIIYELPPTNERYTVKTFSAAEGKLVSAAKTAIAAATTKPQCIVVEALSTENQQEDLLGLGNGALVDVAGFLAAAAVDTIVYSSGTAGGLTITKPTSSAGAVVWMVGVIEADEAGAATSTKMRVNIAPIRAEA